MADFPNEIKNQKICTRSYLYSREKARKIILKSSL